MPLPRRSSTSCTSAASPGTRHRGRRHPGTFAGLIEKIPYLRIPRHHPCGAAADHGLRRAGRAAEDRRGRARNYWGYSTHSFFAPHPATACDPRGARDEFRDMVKALHRAGIGVSSTWSSTTPPRAAGRPDHQLQGPGQRDLLHLDPTDRSRYRDYTGCGNTVNCNHPMVTRFLIDCLDYWVREMHVDGFRFDLASAMARGEDGEPQQHAPVLWGIELSPELGRHHIIAEAWDAAGLYQVGDFPGFRWAEWNGRYRDVVRGSCAATPGLIGRGRDPHRRQQRPLRPPAPPGNSINFVTCHDGFTLADLVSLQRQAQRGQRRGQPRRPQPQPELELRRRGRDRRPARSSPCAGARRATSWPCCC
jgi:isoamylase